MSEQPQNLTNVPNPAPETAKPTATAPEKTGGESKLFTQAELEQIVKERLSREAEKRKVAEEAAAQKAAADAAAKNGEWEKVAKSREQELAALQAQIKAHEVADKKRVIASKVGLPESLSARLVGETDEAIEADAKALLETLPKPTNPSPGPRPAQPGAGASQAETWEQKKARLSGQMPDFQSIRGGGVVWTPETPNE